MALDVGRRCVHHRQMGRGAWGRLLPVAVPVIVLLAGCADSSDTATEARSAPTQTGGTTMQLTSPAFADGAAIPTRYSCDGDDISPPLVIDGLPEGTATLALVVDDPDAPGGTWDHWVAYDIPPATEIPEDVAALGVAGTNSWRRGGYGGPCPPSGIHRYFFTLYAVDTELGLEQGARKGQLLDALEGHVIAEAQLMGTYSR